MLKQCGWQALKPLLLYHGNPCYGIMIPTHSLMPPSLHYSLMLRMYLPNRRPGSILAFHSIHVSRSIIVHSIESLIATSRVPKETPVKPLNSCRSSSYSFVLRMSSNGMNNHLQIIALCILYEKSIGPEWLNTRVPSRGSLGRKSWSRQPRKVLDLLPTHSSAIWNYL